MGQLKTKQKDVNGYAIYHDLIIDAKVSKVFKSVTDPDHLVNWWPYKCTGLAAIGGSYNFYFSPEYDWFAEVIQLIPDTAFYVKMTKSDDDWNNTTFGFDIHEVDRKVLLEFWHVGWPECNGHFRNSSFCWAILLNGLKNYIEKGIVVPFQDRE
jgi:hypothetical protein